MDVDALTVLEFTLTLNELATNATKYGALSTPGGSLTVYSAVLDQETPKRLALQWREHDGPIVKAPTRQGFGSRLMERCIRESLAELRSGV